MTGLLDVIDLKKYFLYKEAAISQAKIFSSFSAIIERRRDYGLAAISQYVHAVDGISFRIKIGETFGLVGESGCGKTTVARCILRLIEPTAGATYFKGIDIMKLKEKELKNLRQHMQLIFQDPTGSLNPRLSVKKQIGEPLRNFHLANTKDELENKVLNLLELVGLSAEQMNKYPYELSGGIKQRVGIARALATNPEFLILDEPTSALDASVGARILNLLISLQKKLNMAYLLIAHDLSVIRYLCDRIAIMYLGKIVETGFPQDIFSNPLHPYTQALLSAVPIPDPKIRREMIKLKGEPPSPINLPRGCRLQNRCSKFMPQCADKEPELLEIENDHSVACYNCT